MVKRLPFILVLTVCATGCEMLSDSMSPYQKKPAWSSTPSPAARPASSASPTPTVGTRHPGTAVPWFFKWMIADPAEPKTEPVKADPVKTNPVKTETTERFERGILPNGSSVSNNLDPAGVPTAPFAPR